MSDNPTTIEPLRATGFQCCEHRNVMNGHQCIHQASFELRWYTSTASGSTLRRIEHLCAVHTGPLARAAKIQVAGIPTVPPPAKFGRPPEAAKPAVMTESEMRHKRYLIVCRETRGDPTPEQHRRYIEYKKRWNAENRGRVRAWKRERRANGLPT